ncbi:hypothetical protein Vretifemale_1483 [Volvox reticuliferus]|uniref:EML-like second beta-propeller domain-containing protein n=1 Tax=Volvox reticuliferus TaxID=1737510 RepID=A0A8J4BYC5_9CHLO|nr:hypothetical protein Vretifemale_1483 [Volvox reticuliferus]
MQVFLDSNLQPVHKTKDSREGITDLKYSPDCRLLAAATADTWIDIYSVSKGYTRLQRCSGHSSTVRGIDWSTDGSVLQSDSADLELLVWNARTGKQIPIPSRDVQFATYTLRLGFPVMGIWPDGSDGTDVNAVARSRGGDVVATCDDDGLVKLFNCPCVLDDAPHRAYRGHSSHVLGVRFNSDDTMLVSVGGYDWAMFQFNVVELVPVDHGPYLPQKVWGALDPEGNDKTQRVARAVGSERFGTGTGDRTSGLSHRHPHGFGRSHKQCIYVHTAYRQNTMGPGPGSCSRVV